MNIDFKLLEEQRNHLLSILCRDNKDEGILLNEETGWGIVHLLDALLDDNEKIT
jgi:hypothetical protein